ncbi:MAG: hypothetical protein GC200_05655 [Tepidisphaera sp.]|nr:hypothetical protein [Tepidisphaera sp.]
MGASFGFLRWRDQRESTRTVLRLARFSLLVSLIEAALLWGVPQAREAILVMAEDADLATLTIFGLCLAALCGLSWYSVRVLLYMRLPDADTWPGIPGWSARNIPRLCGILPGLAVAGAVWGTLREPSLATGLRGTLWLLFAGAVVGCVVGYIFMWLRRRVLRIRHEPRIEPRRLWELPPATRGIALASLTASVLLFVLFTFAPGSARLIGPLSVLVAAGALWVPFGAMLVYFSDRTGLPLVAGFFAIALLWQALNINDNHTVRTLPPPPAPAASAPPTDLGEHFQQWLAARPDLESFKGRPYPVILVSAEGGGIYAAYTSAVALARLQDRSAAIFATHLFATSGVSGGSVGTSVFGAVVSHSVAPMPAPSLAHAKAGLGPCESMASSVLEQDLLSPLLAGALFPDLLQQFLPFPIDYFDRARPLEKGLEDAFDAAGGHGEMRAGIVPLSPSAGVPAMYFSSTCVETGEPAYIGPFPMWARGIYRNADLTRQWRPDATVRLSTAAVLSARFPIVTPAGAVAGKMIDGSPPVTRRFVDGGYFDNPGTATLDAIVQAILHARAQEDPATQIPIAIYVVRIGFSDPPSPEAHSFGELLSPLRALLATRGQHAQETRSRLEQEPGVNVLDLNVNLDTRGGKGGRALPLGWMLSEAARREIRTQIGLSSELSPPPDEPSQNERTLKQIIGLLAP